MEGEMEREKEKEREREKEKGRERVAFGKLRRLLLCSLYHPPSSSSINDSEVKWKKWEWDESQSCNTDEKQRSGFQQYQQLNLIPYKQNQTTTFKTKILPFTTPCLPGTTTKITNSHPFSPPSSFSFSLSLPSLNGWVFQNHKDCQTAALAGALNTVWNKTRTTTTPTTPTTPTSPTSPTTSTTSSSPLSSSSSPPSLSPSPSPPFSFENAPYSANEIGEVMDYYLRREVVKLIKELQEGGEKERKGKEGKEGEGRGEMDWEGLKQNIKFRLSQNGIIHGDSAIDSPPLPPHHFFLSFFLPDPVSHFSKKREREKKNNKEKEEEEEEEKEEENEDLPIPTSLFPLYQYLSSLYYSSHYLTHRLFSHLLSLRRLRLINRETHCSLLPSLILSSLPFGVSVSSLSEYSWREIMELMKKGGGGWEKEGEEKEEEKEEEDSPVALLVRLPRHLAMIFGIGEAQDLPIPSPSPSFSTTSTRTNKNKQRHVLVGRPSGGQSPCGWIPFSWKDKEKGEGMWMDDIWLGEKRGRGEEGGEEGAEEGREGGVGGGEKYGLTMWESVCVPGSDGRGKPVFVAQREVYVVRRKGVKELEREVEERRREVEEGERMGVNEDWIYPQGVRCGKCKRDYWWMREEEKEKEREGAL